MELITPLKSIEGNPVIYVFYHSQNDIALYEYVNKRRLLRMIVSDTDELRNICNQWGYIENKEHPDYPNFKFKLKAN